MSAPNSSRVYVVPAMESGDQSLVQAPVTILGEAEYADLQSQKLEFQWDGQADLVTGGLWLPDLILMTVEWDIYSNNELYCKIVDRSVGLVFGWWDRLYRR